MAFLDSECLPQNVYFRWKLEVVSIFYFLRIDNCSKLNYHVTFLQKIEILFLVCTLNIFQITRAEWKFFHSNLIIRDTFQDSAQDPEENHCTKIHLSTLLLSPFQFTLHPLLVHLGSSSYYINLFSILRLVSWI